MKPRIRTIKPEAHTDEDLWDLEEETGFPIFRAFTGLWAHADREGRFEWRHRPLKAGILPYWSGDFSRVLDALATRGFIVKYTCDGREYGLIPGFLKHQVINNREEPSKLPAPPACCGESEQSQDVPREDDASGTREARDDDATGTRLVHAQGERNGTEWNGREEERNGNARPDASPASGTRPRDPQNLADALRIPIRERAKLHVDKPHMVTWTQPHEWPELVAFARDISTALGWHDPRITSPTHAAVKKLIEVLSAFDADELARAVAAAPSDEWLNDGRKGLSALSAEVVGRLLNPKRSAGSKGRVAQTNHGKTGLEGVEVIQ